MREPLLLDRRQALALLGASAFAGPVFAADAAPSPNGDLFVSAAQMADGGHAILAFDETGHIRRTIHIPARGHDFALRTDGLTIAFARRPGTFAVAFYPAFGTKREPVVFATPQGRHFNGHGAFSRDGRLLYTTENDFERAAGVIGIYNTATFERLGEFSSGGVGPHEVLGLGNTIIAIANGGIETHPDFPRAKLNLSSMRPNLAYVDTRSGALLERHEWPAALRSLSIRHLTATVQDGADVVWFGCQWQAAAGSGAGLVGRHKRGGDLELLPPPAGGWPLLRDYIGSLASFDDGRRIAASSPRSGHVAVWDAEGNFRSLLAKDDVCGLAGRKSSLAFSTGAGVLGTATNTADVQFRETRFDNHMRVIG